MASILQLDEHLGQEYKVFSHAPLVSSPFFLHFFLYNRRYAACGIKTVPDHCRLELAWPNIVYSIIVSVSI